MIALLAAAALAVPDLVIDQYQLDNGLTVLLHEDHDVPVAAVYVLYKVGSKDERPGRTGFAHLFEHVMFQGSKHVGDDVHLRTIEEAGGSANGATFPDRTVYFETVPSNYLERTLYLEADRMGFLLDTLNQQKLDNQRDVVRNERRQRYENAPYAKALFPLTEALWPEGHPYHWLTIGSHQDLAAAALEDVKQFFRAHYTPRNAVLVVAGDFDPPRTKAWIAKWFGPLSGTAAPPPPSPPPLLPIAEDRRIEVDDAVRLPRLTLAWRSPAFYAPGDADLDILASILAGSKAARLWRKLVLDKQWAQSVGVSQQSAMLGSSFQIQALAKPGRGLGDLEQGVLEELAAIARTPPTADEVARARYTYERSFLGALESALGRAQLLAGYWHYLDDPGYLPKDVARYRKVTPESVQKAAADLVAQKKIAVEVWPRGAAR